MTIPTTGVNAWRQEGLFPAENVRIMCTIFVEEAGNRNTFSVEVRDILSDSLVAQWVRPLRAIDSLSRDLEEVLELVRSHVQHHALPFGAESSRV